MSNRFELIKDDTRNRIDEIETLIIYIKSED